MIVGLAGTLVTQAVIYLVARRSRSGRVETSEAASLWAESQAIRGELRTRVVALEDRVEELTSANETLRGENHALRLELAELRGALDALRKAPR